jgi:hypothetical protein
MQSELSLSLMDDVCTGAAQQCVKSAAIVRAVIIDVKRLSYRLCNASNKQRHARSLSAADRATMCV